MFGINDEGAHDPSESDMNSEVRAELEKLAKPKTNWTQGLLVLAVSVVLFSAAGSFGDGMDWAFLGSLIVVIFIHELGHLAAMWWFDYQDLRMFFIPFFGAAAAGRKRTATGAQRAIVSLMGPIPGIFIGFAMVAWWLATESELTGMFALLFLALNALNLLPVMPLDGGRFFDTILFSRWPGFQLAVNLLTGVLLAVAGFSIGDWIFVGLGVMLLLFSRTGFKVARLGRQLRKELPTEVRTAEEIPDSLLGPLSERVTNEVLLGSENQPKLIAQYLDMVWQNVHSEPPRAAATLALLGVYVVALVGMPVVGITAVVVGNDEVIVEAVSEDESSRKVASLWGQTLWETELDEDGAFHGDYTDYLFLSDQASVTGSWTHGYRDGTWTHFGPDGDPVAEANFAAGVFESGRRRDDTGWADCSFDELPIELQSSTEAHQSEPLSVTGLERRERAVREPDIPRQ